MRNVQDASYRTERISIAATSYVDLLRFLGDSTKYSCAEYHATGLTLRPLGFSHGSKICVLGRWGCRLGCIYKFTTCYVHACFSFYVWWRFLTARRRTGTHTLPNVGYTCFPPDKSSGIFISFHDTAQLPALQSTPTNLRRRVQIQPPNSQLEAVQPSIASRNVQIQPPPLAVLKIDFRHQQLVFLLP
jgi:hypothetical protein